MKTVDMTPASKADLRKVESDSVDLDQKLADLAKQASQSIVAISDSIAEIRVAILSIDSRLKAVEQFIAFRRKLKPEEPR